MLTLEMRVLRRAAELLGGERALARHLKVSETDLYLWLQGMEKPERQMLSHAMDVLIERGDTSGLGQMHSMAPEHNDGPHMQMSSWACGDDDSKPA